MSAVAPTTGTKTTWAIDPVHTDVEFGVRHMMLSTIKGYFPGVSGTIHLHEANWVDSSVEVELDAATITTRVDQRDAHLKSADFLDVENYPKITFKSVEISNVGGDEYEIKGELTIKTVTQPVVLKTTFNGRATTPFGTEIVSFTAETTINRKDFGINYNAALETGGVLIGDKLKVAIEVEAVLQQA